MTNVTPQLVGAAEDVFRRGGGVLRTSNAIAAGIHPRTLYFMRDQGVLERLSRGVYHLAALPLPEKPDVVAVVRRVPNGVVSLVSALDLYGLTTQIPHAVDIALEWGVKRPRIDYPPIRVFRMSQASFQAGVVQVPIGATLVPVFDVGKTVADCFKFRSRVGQDVAVEALREAIRTRRATAAEVMRWAAVDRVTAIVRPYIEALQ
jgi:predicted transcriptional regulator of viral defense system